MAIDLPKLLCLCTCWLSAESCCSAYTSSAHPAKPSGVQGRGHILHIGVSFSQTLHRLKLKTTESCVLHKWVEQFSVGFCVLNKPPSQQSQSARDIVLPSAASEAQN